ncbi:MAG: amino acid adenylation domain-containing protein [Deltaproteobacteria bacterium]
MDRPTTSPLELSSKKRALLDLLLREEGMAPAHNETIPRRHSDASIPLSFAQERLWYLDQLEPNSPLYNVSRALRLRGPLDVKALRKALDRLVGRHEMLRTTITAVNGIPVQIVGQSHNVDLKVIDLSKMSETERDGEVQRVLNEETLRPFALSSDLMLRAVLLKLGTDDHVLLLAIHHIASDAWSMMVLLRELGALYESASSGNPSPLAELPIQYADFAIWQRQWLHGEVLARHLAYWRLRLKDAPPLLDLPTDLPRRAAQNHHGGQRSLRLSESLSAALTTLSRREGATLFMVLLAAFKLLLHRQAGQDDIIVGSPVGGRSRLETEGLIGIFINALALRTDLSRNPAFRELLTRVRESCVGAYAHQEIPFEKLVEELQPARDSSRSPLFQVLFDMLNLPDMGTACLSGLNVENMPRSHITAKYDLTLFAIERQPEIRVLFIYNTDLFSGTRIAELLGQYQVLLEQVVENPDRRIDDYSLVTSAAKSYLPDATAPLDDRWYGAVHEAMAAFAQKQPDKLAVQDRDAAWTYKELNERSNQLAHCLREHGVVLGDTVAIYAHRNASLVWALFGVLKAGAAFCVIDPSHPADRFREYLSAAKPTAVIQISAAGELNPQMEELLNGVSLRCRLMLPDLNGARCSQFLSQYPTENPNVKVGPDDLAYVIFTSGSTGKPKGVMGRHGPLTHFSPWMAETFAMRETDRFSLLSGLSFNLLHRDVFTPLGLGATLCIPDAEDIAPGRLAEWLSKEAISIVHLTPAMGQILTRANGIKLPSLRCVFFGGDQLRKPDVELLWELTTAVTVVCFYGATETQRAVGHFIVPPKNHKLQEETPLKEVMPLGRGIQDVQLLVLNSSGQLAGVGELGEIYVRSPHLAIGYLNDEQLTQERFVLNPFTQEPNDRLYKTAELGRYLPDGNIQWVGRMDRQVNIRGFRIEPREIEAALADHPAVQEAAVMAREDQPGDKRLVAYLVLIKDHEATINELRRFLKQKLPDFMIPASFVFLESLPITPNGKTDFQALPTPNPSSATSQSQFVAPRTALETVIADVWKEVLGVDQVGVYDNFFDLGGHSLLSLQVIARLERETGLKVNPMAFVTQTLGQLASVYERRMPRRGHMASNSFTRRLWGTLKSALFFRKNRP